MLIMNIYQRFKFSSELTGEINEQSKKEKTSCNQCCAGYQCSAGLFLFFSILLEVFRGFSETSNSLSD